MKAKNNALNGAAFSNSFWRVAALAAASAFVGVSQVEAALYYWSDSDPGYYSRPATTVPVRRQKVRRQQAKPAEHAEKESAKPQGPLVIAISIERQSLKIYDANGFFAETPISTGMKGHPTPMGVFSIIQKHKLHHSNIYSGAPMPFMQRITWSGVAMHAGVLPGYPASHGCIRMPMAFAVKMWGWTKMGARVVVVPGEITPSSFSHPLLVTQKVVPQPAASVEPNGSAKADRTADAGTMLKPEESLELRSTVGHDTSVKPEMDEASVPATLRERTRTADASSAMPASTAPATMTDAGRGNTASRETVAAEAAAAQPAQADAASTETKSGSATTENTTSEAAPATAGHSETVSAQEKAAEARPDESKAAEAVPAEVKPAETGTAVAAVKTEEAHAPAQTGSEAVPAATPAAEGAKPEATKAVAAEPAKTGDVKTETVKAEASPTPDKSLDKPDAAVGTIADAPAGVADVKKDQTRASDPGKPATAKPETVVSAAPKRSGQIAVFVSRKDSKLYVRQNFAPLFEVPVTIAASDRPLGTHVFTAEVDKTDANVLRWSVVSLPVTARSAARGDDDERVSRKRKTAAASEAKPLPVPDSPTEALDRLNIPADTMARITEALSTGGSIIVSDQGIAAGETGEGTDFIVSLR